MAEASLSGASGQNEATDKPSTANPARSASSGRSAGHRPMLPHSRPWGLSFSTRLSLHCSDKCLKWGSRLSRCDYRWRVRRVQHTVLFVFLAATVYVMSHMHDGIYARQDNYFTPTLCDINASWVTAHVPVHYDRAQKQTTYDVDLDISFSHDSAAIGHQVRREMDKRRPDMLAEGELPTQSWWCYLSYNRSHVRLFRPDINYQEFYGSLMKCLAIGLMCGCLPFLFCSWCCIWCVPHATDLEKHPHTRHPKRVRDDGTTPVVDWCDDEGADGYRNY